MNIKILSSVCAFFAMLEPAMAETIDCVIEPKALVSVSANDQGLISEVLVERGQEVRVGEPVLQQVSAIETLQLELAAAVAASDITLRSEQERHRFRLIELERVTALVDRGANAQAALDDAEIEVRLSELAIDRAQFDLERARIERELAAVRLVRRTIAAPLSGIVTSVSVAPGEYAGAQTELLQIADLNPLHVEVFMPAEFFSRIRVGDQNMVHLVAPMERSYFATASVVDPVFDAASGTFGLRLILPNPDHLVPAGVRCQLELAEE
jgi:membrane fusion protein (multidrug efflux system)